MPASIHFPVLGSTVQETRPFLVRKHLLTDSGAIFVFDGSKLTNINQSGAIVATSVSGDYFARSFSVLWKRCGHDRSEISGYIFSLTEMPQRILRQARHHLAVSLFPELCSNLTLTTKIKSSRLVLWPDNTSDVFLLSPVTSPPPTPVLSATPPSLDFGPIAVGTSVDKTFTVQNTGGGTLTGSASASAPFSIVGNNSFSLAANQSQQITVRFSPTSAGSANRFVDFTSNGWKCVTGCNGNWRNLLLHLPLICLRRAWSSAVSHLAALVLPKPLR